MYQRELDLEKRIRYVQEYLLARVWYIAQILPPPKENLRQINLTITWFLWKGEIFRVPLSTLQRTKEDGGWGMVHTAANCMALLFYHMNELGRKNGRMTAEWMRWWGLQAKTPNPPYNRRTPQKMAYLHQYDMESAYLATRRRDETARGYKKHIHETIHTSMRQTAGEQELRVTKMWPNTNWTRVWDNLHETPVSDSTRFIWYKMLHDIIPTNERLQRIRMVQTDTRRKCMMKDTLEHRLSACGEGHKIWEYTKRLLARILQTTPSRVPVEWLLRPQLKTWPPKRQKSLLWIIAPVILFRSQQNKTPNLMFL